MTAELPGSESTAPVESVVVGVVAERPGEPRVLEAGRLAIELEDPIRSAIVLTHDHRLVRKEHHDELQPVR